MSVLASRPTLRWALPAAALVAVIGVGNAGRMLVANAADSLPQRSPQQLLMDIAQAKVNGLSGTIVQKSDLGLPPLPDFGTTDGTDLTSMVNGNHTVRFWYDGPKHLRLSFQGTNSQEKDLIRNNQDVWTYDSADKSATHRTLTSEEAKKQQRKGAPSVLPSGTPSVMPSSLSGGVDQLLSTLAPTTKISTAGTDTVAGRKAYELVVAPKDDMSRVQQIKIAVDGTKHIPLRLQVFARGSDGPAFEAAFTHVSFHRPDSSEFTFTPPAGTKVTEVKPGQHKAHSKEQPRDHKKSAEQKPQVIGNGWTSVVVAKGVKTTIPAGKTAEQKKASEAATKFLDSLPKVQGSWGSGRLLESKLFSVLLTDDGRLIAGAVDPAQLYQAAEQTN